MRFPLRSDVARRAGASAVALLVLAALIAACAQEPSTAPGRMTPLALSMRLPAGAPAQQIDEVRVSAFDGTQRIRGPVAADIDLRARTFSASLSLPSGTALTITVEVIGTVSFPDESISERGVIFLGRKDGIVAGEATTVEVVLDPFVPAGISAAVENDGLAHIRWGSVPGVSRYQLSVQHAGEAPTFLTVRDSTAIICDVAELGTYFCRVRALSTFATGAFSNSVRTVVPPCGQRGTHEPDAER